MKQYLSINSHSETDICIKKIAARVVFINNVPSILSDSGARVELSPFDAAVWLAVCSGKTIEDICNDVLSNYKLAITSKNCLEDIKDSLKFFYQNDLIQLEYKNNQIEILSWEKDAIAQCHFALTHYCNLRCRHCLISRQEYPELSTDEVLTIIQALWTQGCQTINFSGGEVLTRRDFSIIIEHVHNIGIRYGFNTNGTLFTPEVFNLIQKYRPENIGISLYGDSNKIHDWITRGEGSFSLTINNIKILKNLNLPVTIKTMVMKDNYRNIENVAQLALALGCKIILDAHIFPKQDGSREPLLQLLDLESLQSFYCSHTAMRSESENSRWAITEQFVCSAGLDRCALDPYGQLYPCAAFPKAIGSLRQEPLRELIAKWRRDCDFYLPRFIDLVECQKCLNKSKCFPCPGISFIEEGDSNRKSSWICTVTNCRSKQ